jgi:hypothetical protein
VGIGTSIALIASAFLFWASRTYQDGGEVAALHWEHHTYRETWMDVEREDWEKDLVPQAQRAPVNGTGEHAGIAKIRGCYSKFHHTNRVYAGQTCSGAGKHRHCHSRYNHIPVYYQFCAYTTQDWVIVSDQKREGSDTNTEWATVDCDVLDRSRRTGAYDVGISYVDDGERFEHVEHPKTEGDYTSWRIGERVQVELYNIGFVRDVIRVEHIADMTPAE